MAQPLVSVIIPCYNAQKFVEKAVRSIMEQTYTNLEILCCDDCSTDKTLIILQKLSQEDSRVKVIKNEQNLKIVQTLNKLVYLSSGKYIARMDADDISLPNRIEKQVEFMEKNAEVGLCGCNAFHINEKDKKIGKSFLPLSFEDNKFFLQFYSTFYHPTILAKSEVFKENLYDEDFICAEDYELWCRLVFEKGIRAENLRDRLFLYRMNSQGISQKNAEKQKENSAKIFLTKNILKENKNFHCNVYFNYSTDLTGIKTYLKSQQTLLNRTKAKYSKIPFIKMLSFCKHKKLFIELIKIILSKNGFYAFLCFLFKRF